jgi:D-alanyl-lipoteichoic acid acyltransferase DltB (MBOAT superfamily)
MIGAKGFLVFASLFFYSWWNISYLPIILSSLLFNYVIGNSLNENFKKVQLHKKSLLTFGIIANVALLGYFKYTDFLIENVNLAFDTSVPLVHLALPLAISFFTFQQIAYLVDSYRGETAEYDFLNYALFVTFFPQLIAGPIVHHSEMMPQFASRWNLVKNYKNIALGLFIFSIGLFKKVVIADSFAVWATAGFDTATTLNLFAAWATSLSYTFQLYFDFSGYTDMAIGAALLFNIKLPINFNSPYKALDIQDFWRRWHITLSRFLRDYIYIPLGGNRKGSFRTYTNLLATFIIGGIWHGAGWTFVFWGFLHGLALVIHRFWKSMGLAMPKIVAWFITFNFINIAWVFFRAKEWGDAVKVLKGMIDIDSINMEVFIGGKIFIIKNIYNNLQETIAAPMDDKLSYIITGSLNHYKDDTVMFLHILVSAIIVTSFKNSSQIAKTFKVNYLYLSINLLLFITSIYIFSCGVYSEFLYFNF